MIQQNQQVSKFIELLKESLSTRRFVKITLGNYQGDSNQLKQVSIKKVLIKQGEKLSITYRYKTKDEVKNYSIEEGIALVIEFLNNGFHVATLFTTTKDIQYEILKNGKIVLRNLKASNTDTPTLLHNEEKKYLIASQHKPYLNLLHITDKQGKVLNHAQDKYKQINHYIDILSSLLKALPSQTELNVVDMGAGKGYLTFALYDYLSNVLKLNVHVTGVEFRADLVKLCNQIAIDSNFTKLCFEEGSIENYQANSMQVLIALHACDTATDDAIAKGIKAHSDLIVVAPCCHKQIRRELERTKISNDVSFLTRHGIFLERQAEMITDGIRALILEYFGYKTKVFEFISDAHTPKNIMIVGERREASLKNKEEILLKIHEAKKYFGIETHHLESLLMS